MFIVQLPKMMTGMTSIPCCCQLVMDETPVHYFPSLKGTYEATGVYVCVACSDEKCIITGLFVTDPDGNIFLFRLLWKGTTQKLAEEPWDTLEVDSAM